MLVEKQKLDAIISMPSGVFKPYAGVSTAIVLYTKTNSGGTDHVWFYDMRADGLSLDDKRQPISENDIPDILKRWQNLEAEKDRQRTEQSFFVPKAEIAAQGYNLSLNRYKEVVHEEVEYVPPQKILEELDQLEQEIQEGLKVLKEMFPSTPHVSFAYREQETKPARDEASGSEGNE